MQPTMKRPKIVENTSPNPRMAPQIFPKLNLCQDPRGKVGKAETSIW